MGRLFLSAAVLLALSLMFSVGYAADGAGKYMVRGVGSVKCSQLVSAIDTKDENARKEAVLLYTSWLNGYMSYINRVEKGTYDIAPLVDGSNVLAVVVNQCRSNPNALVESISTRVIGFLSKAKVNAETPLIVLTVGDRKGNFHKATLIALQERLTALKLYSGKADGDFGAPSQQALRAFQKSEKLKETGFPDPDTVMRALLK